MVAGTIAGTCVGGASTIGTAQLAFSVGVSPWWFSLGLGLGLVVMAAFYASPLRRAGLETVPEYLGTPLRPRWRGRCQHHLLARHPVQRGCQRAVGHRAGWHDLRPGALAVRRWRSVLLVIPCVLFGGLKGAGISGLLKMGILWLTMLAAGVYACLLAGRAVPRFRRDAFPASPWFSPFGAGGADLRGQRGFADRSG